MGRLAGHGSQLEFTGNGFGHRLNPWPSLAAVTLLSIPFTDKYRYTAYHTRNDTVEHVEPLAIEQAIAVIAVMIKFTQGVDTRKT